MTSTGSGKLPGASLSSLDEVDRIGNEAVRSITRGNSSNNDGQENLWLGVCVYTESEGHEELPIHGVWILLSDEKLIVMSLDMRGWICWWGLDSGECIDKLHIGDDRGVLSTCFATEERLLCVVCVHSPMVIFVVDAVKRRRLYDIFGGRFRTIQYRITDDGTYIVCNVSYGSAKKRYFDLKGRAFLASDSVPDSLSHGTDQYSIKPPGFDQEPDLKDYRFRVGKRMEIVQIGNSEVFATFPSDGNPENLRVIRAHDLPLTDLESKDCITASESSYLLVARELSTRRRKRVKKERDSSSGSSSSDSDKNSKKAQEEDQQDEEDLDIWDGPDGIAHKRNLLSKSPSVYVVYVAFPCNVNSMVYVYHIDISKLQVDLIEKIPIALTSIDAICVSPFEGEATLAVVDSLFDQTLLVLNDEYEPINRVYFGSSNVDISSVHWSSPFTIELGNRWMFDLFSESVLESTSLYVYPFTVNCFPPLPPPRIASENPINRVRSLSVHGTSSSWYYDYGHRYKRNRVDHREYDDESESTQTIGLMEGIRFFLPRTGLKIWILEIHKLAIRGDELFGLMSFFMQWGIDVGLDRQIAKVLQIEWPKHNRFRYVVDHNHEHKMYSLLATNDDRWVCTDRFTAMQTLGIVSLFIGLIASQTLSEHQQAIMSSLVSHYGIVYPEKLIEDKKYVFPCLDLLSGFILNANTSEDIQIASRLLLQVTIERMPSAIRMARAAQWAARLHVSNGNDSRAAVVLGMMGVTHPEDLAPATARLVAARLRQFIPMKKKEETVIGAELLARGFYVWCPYIDDLPGLIRDLIVNYDFNAPSGPTAEEGSASAPAPPIQGGVAGGGASMSSASQRALTEIGTTQPLLFIQTLGKEALRPGNHRYALTALSSFIKRKPVVLLRHLPSVVEIVIKTLDPSESDIRKACLKYSTVVLHQLVKRYPMVAFHQQTQRFAVGTVDSIILIYDLRTATKWRILEGHTGPVSAVCFEPKTGERLVSYSAQESAVRVWQTGAGTGFFGGLLGIQGSCLRVGRLPPLPSTTATTATSTNQEENSDGAGNAKAYSSNSDTIHNCKLDWSRMVREDGKTVVSLDEILQS